MIPEGSRRLLTFRLDTERRQRLRARLAREGRTMSEVVTSGLRQYVQHARPRSGGHGDGDSALVLPERLAARLRELRSSGRSELLSATLAALHEAGWPLRPLAEALGISKQAVQARVRRRAAARAAAQVAQAVQAAQAVPAAQAARAGDLAEIGRPGAGELAVTCEPPPPFPQRRVASAAGLRPHLTVKIDYTLRASAHRVAADEGHSLTQVVEGILDRYLKHGLIDKDADAGSAAGAGAGAGQVPREASRAASRSR
jgi:antitoxin component of RelBE/YafQ-DinJ toxin-antitoxin module